MTSNTANRWWLIEHVSLGAYLGEARHPRTGRIVPLFRAQDRSHPAKPFASREAAMQRIKAISKEPALFAIIPLNG